MTSFLKEDLFRFNIRFNIKKEILEKESLIYISYSLIVSPLVQIIKKFENTPQCIVRLPSSVDKLIDSQCRATIGIVSNFHWFVVRQVDPKRTSTF